MRKIKYPNGTQYIEAYLKIFEDEKDDLQQKLTSLKGTYSVKLGFLPGNIDEILKADFSQLVDWYKRFIVLKQNTRNAINKRLEKIFNYDKWRDKIAEYFMDPSNGFNISSCYYCDMTYINGYKVDAVAEGLFFLNEATEDDLKKLTSSAIRRKKIFKCKPFKNKAQFDEIAKSFKWSKDKLKKTVLDNKDYKYQFDLDHVLPKSECRFVALSLFNFVPCCQICNQRLKRVKVLGHQGVPSVNLSPTSDTYEFDSNSQFYIIPNEHATVASICPSTHPQDYKLQLVSENDDYDFFIKLFDLENRYQHHKKIALHWLEMKFKYSDARIKMLSNALDPSNFTFERIKSDIFQDSLYESGDLSFSKMRKDILG
jgi:hypothetical protein